MNNRLRILIISIFITTSLLASDWAFGKKIHGRAYKYIMDIPNTMHEVADSVNNGANELLYFDTATDVVLIISGRVSKFNSVNEYIDCSNPELEQKLQSAFGDSSVQLISCARSKYYPGKSAVVHFSLADVKDGLNTYVVYFIHNKEKDLQISFTYQKESEQQSLAYVDGIMQTFKLK
jgi:hypothetical protein